MSAGLAACSAHRQLARSMRCAKTTVTRQAERLSRHAILFHAHTLASLSELAEPIVHDHFETFIGRQDHALGIGTAVGAHSRFVYDLDPAPHRGSRRRPNRQEKQPIRVSRPYVVSIDRTIRQLLSKVSAQDRLECIVDGRIDYQTVVRHPKFSNRVQLRIYPNPERGPKGSPRSPEAIARDWAMFPADQLHQLLKHTCSDQKKETISFGRRLESILGRMHLIAVWKNFIKLRSERRPDKTTPAMRLGLTDAVWRWEWVLSRRLFPARVEPSGAFIKTYFKRWTPGLPELVKRHAV